MINDKFSEESHNKCLMNELEAAIANGNHQQAAILAKELAIKRVSCSLSGKMPNGKEKPLRTSPIVYVIIIFTLTIHFNNV